MALSPGQRHRLKIEMRQKLDQQQAVAIADGESMHLQARAVDRDAARLKGMTMAERTEIKKQEFLPNYLPTAQRYLDEKKVYKNPIFSFCVVWLFDTGDFQKGLDWADIAIEQGQLTPGFKSGFPAFVADTVLQWAQLESEAGNSVEPYFSRTFKNVTEKWRIHEKIQAKWYKFAALELLKGDTTEAKASAIDNIETLERADAYLARAHQLNFKSGVRTHRARIAMRIRALSTE